ncbi:uncharacterized protein LOC132952291 [Metopolophium dirhodum]|uniref:uncharacterized protein LOC132952291 n=1 Tax=Metopolophium dirhodum TaxID=44670 RepID=UPI0029904909|nr:uncharacterized protein LOC132952291 [Metopolophium dirhodum]
MNRYYEAYPKSGGTMLTLPPPPLSDPSATWNSYSSEPVKGLGNRIKPDRNRQAVNVQKMQWRNSNWVDGFPELVGSMTIADVSPRFAVKRILLLYENAQYREAANFVNRLSHNTFKAILDQLPIDLFVEAMPHSLSILEALYAKVFLSSDCGVKVLRPDHVLMRLVKLFTGTAAGGADRWLGSTRKLLKVIVLSEPKLRKALQVRRRSLDKAVEGLGQHGLVGTSDETLTNLHDALKVEFQKLVDTYKAALLKLEELSLSGKRDGVSKGPAPVQASHQRQLSLQQSDIQERLIKNKTLLNVVEPVLENKSMAILLTILKRRVEYDKDALFQFTQLRKELKVESEHVVAPLLMRYSHACEQVLEFMKEVAEDEDSSDISGYHSDSDSAIMMSGNSPYVTKRARHNFISRSVRSSSNHSTRTRLVMSTGSSSASPPDGGESSTTATPNWEWSTEKSMNTLTCCRKCGPQTALQLQTVSDDREKLALQTELETTKVELERTKAKLESLNKATKQAQSSKELSGPRLVRCYGNLYSQARVEALEKLDVLPQLADATELKSKILFSVVVLAFRSTQAMLSLKKEQVKRLLFYPTPSGSAHVELEASICSYLRRTVDTFDLTQCIEEVSSQLWATLYDYPCLKTCAGLHQYICDAVRLAWALVNQTPSFVLEYEQRSFKRDLHVRYHSSDLESNQVRTYLWPALLEGQAGPCVHKAVVLT